ncbi:hypothetical protein QN382_23330 [Pseudomonas sp. 10B1]|uniref:hypothetical protein n=1 Tax=unclassified Pseudomonas TaxID=196821 RepID=UPI002B22798B|nr:MULTISPECIES: hypothetical protein [unclassified Pseudomonas]MEA9997040.1 hypothetical protein [Pseudomonas sp. AA4]MEB0089230.1 hypothetical protein [Pseudomonas sp. RTI1]MEB0128422.1 hypothetical protein [Pseudomonas sp. CCC1.2]MEB0155320.1 hypothetical protein [Pseudomonas sp. CCC4.3]MEB0221688.1 hypothetical protein [Pseudomonas sp. AB12(2023)]
MSNVIVYQNSDGQMSVVTMTQDYSVEEHGAAQVPTGTSYWIVPATDIAQAYADQGAYRNAWSVSEESIGRTPDGTGTQGAVPAGAVQ